MWVSFGVCGSFSAHALMLPSVQFGRYSVTAERFVRFNDEGDDGDNHYKTVTCES